MTEVAYAHRTLEELKILKNEALERRQKLFDTIDKQPGEMTTPQDISLRNINDNIHRICRAIDAQIDFEDSL